MSTRPAPERPLRVGLSTCPNDTFAFAGLLAGEVRIAGRELALEFADVEELNRRVLAGELDASKASFALALEVTGAYGLLEAGSALGFGVGPLLVRRAPHADERAPRRSRPRLFSPGEHTTAFLLWRMFHAGEADASHVPFHRIVPALEEGRAEQGLLIHEGRFTWQGRGLELVEDLGTRWEQECGLPLPLGGILARRSLGPRLARELSDALRASLAWARANPRRALATMRAHAVELDDAVLWQHVELYVNEWTQALGPLGRRALAELERRGRALAAREGRTDAGAALEVLG